MIMEYNILVIFENSNGLHSLKSTKKNGNIFYSGLNEKNVFLVFSNYFTCGIRN